MTGPYGRRSYVEGLLPTGGETVPLWGGHVMLREMPDGTGVDAASAYPMGGFAPVSDLTEGLGQLQARGAVSLSLVADPLNTPDPGALASRADTHRRLKTHYVIDREVGPFAPSKHHRAEIRRARRRVTVERVRLSEAMADWRGLYGNLVDRRGIGESARLDDRHFTALAADSQALVLAARQAERIVAMSIWLSDGEVAHNHLGASGDAGYRSGAGYALYAAAIEALSDCRIIDLGGMPGLTDDNSHGLARFKRGFANDERATWFSGFVLDRDRYGAAVRASGAASGGFFFPAYRAR